MRPADNVHDKAAKPFKTRRAHTRYKANVARYFVSGWADARSRHRARSGCRHGIAGYERRFATLQACGRLEATGAPTRRMRAHAGARWGSDGRDWSRRTQLNLKYRHPQYSRSSSP